MSVSMPIICYTVEPRGFCSGVSRATKMLDQILKLYKTVYVVEDVIHNKPFMRKAYERGVVKTDSVDDIPDNSVVMFSAHGTSPDVLLQAEKKSLTVIDATCPIVSEIHKSVKNSVECKKKIIIVGDMSHPEVVGIMGYIPQSDAFVVSNEAEVDLLPDLRDSKVAYYTQTTLDVYTVGGTIEALKKKIPHVENPVTTNICNATRERQRAICEISKLVDIVLIFGSMYSSNASRLVDVSRGSGVKSVYLAETVDDIKLSWFDGVRSFAISSGASCPDSIIDDAIKFLKNNLNITIKDFSL